MLAYDTMLEIRQSEERKSYRPARQSSNGYEILKA